MKKLTISCLLGCSLLVGCESTSESTKQITGQLIQVSNNLHVQHLKTIDAYIATLEGVKTDIDTLTQVIAADRGTLWEVKNALREAQAKAVINYAVTEFDERVEQEIFSKFDQLIEQKYWPTIVEKHEGFQAEERVLKEKLNNHFCVNNADGCKPAGFKDYSALYEKYRDYGIVSEYLLHLGYEDETLQWQKLTELYVQVKTDVKTKAQNLANKQALEFDASNQEILDELRTVSSKINEVIVSIKNERELIALSWQSAENTLNYLVAEINKPSVWQLVLQGASTQTRGIIANYSSQVKSSLSGIVGEFGAELLTEPLELAGQNIVEHGMNSLNRGIDGFLAGAAERINNKADEFNNRNSKTKS